MDKDSHIPVRRSAPLALTALVVTVPLTLAATVSEAVTPRGTSSGAEVRLLSTSGEAMSLARCVSEAARQWCGAQDSLDGVLTGGFAVHVTNEASATSECVAVVDSTLQGDAVPQLLALSHLIDLPPPVC